uniref:Uncharacterized protein n=1 Tax=Setaria viridis TaxID=4556 RepID=A0A4U6UQU3_SETVI|nr:hypothetical protein SEVIR_5G292750v2 [Setaria viridis]
MHAGVLLTHRLWCCSGACAATPAFRICWPKLHEASVAVRLGRRARCSRPRRVARPC